MAFLKLYCGPMLSSKGRHLVAEYERARIALREILVLAPARDTRSNGKITTRILRTDGSTEMVDVLDAITVNDASHLADLFRKHRFDFLIVDECQFFPCGTVHADGSIEYGWFASAIEELLYARRHDDLYIVLAGLDLDFRRRPFGAMGELASLADEVIKTTGVCMNPECRAVDARFSIRLDRSQELIMPGDKELYEVRCRKCHHIGAPPNDSGRSS